jgi:hypothetical protein
MAGFILKTHKKETRSDEYRVTAVSILFDC